MKMGGGCGPTVMDSVPVSEKTPPPKKEVIVVSESFRCLGSIDNDGIWRNLRGEELRDVIGWIDYLS